MSDTYTVGAEEAGQRLDIWCVAHIPDFSRAALQRAIKEEAILVNDSPVKPRYEVKVGDVVRVADMAHEEEAAEVPTELAIPILYEDEDMLAINKPPGISVHPAPGERGYTISQWFAARYPSSASVGDKGRPGIVHRLDKDTSGVLLLAKTDMAWQRLKEQFKRHRVRKEYVTLVYGIPGERSGRITRPIDRSPKNPNRRTVIESGKPAITEWKTEETFGNDYSLLRVYLFTGRTHQIRVHLHFLGYPVVGDNLYTFKRQRSPEGVVRQLLHAHLIAFQLPSGKKKTLEAPLPEDFLSVLSSLRK